MDKFILCALILSFNLVSSFPAKLNTLISNIQETARNDTLRLIALAALEEKEEEQAEAEAEAEAREEARGRAMEKLRSLGLELGPESQLESESVEQVPIETMTPVVVRDNELEEEYRDIEVEQLEALAKEDGKNRELLNFQIERSEPAEVCQL